MFVSGHSPTEDELVADALELVLPPGAPAPLLEPRVRAPRPGRRPDERAAVHRLRRRADHRAVRARAHDLGRRTRRRRRAISSTSTRAPSGRSPRPISRRRRPRGSSGRRSRISAAGRRSWQPATTACWTRAASRRCGSRRSCTTPTAGCSAGASASCCTTAKVSSTAVTAVRWPGTSPACSSTARRGSAAPR